MGQLVDGAWVKGDVATRKGGAFERPASTFRSWVTADGRPGPSGEGGFPAVAGRYHLYVSLACPWAHRTLVVRALKDLEDLIAVSVVHPDMGEEGWTFDAGFPGATGDRLMGLRRLFEVYQRADPTATTKVTVPVLWDAERGRIVSNESSEIIRMMTAAWDGITGNDLDLWPEALRGEIEAVNARVYDTLNNGVYRAGFATSQEAYDAAVHPLFDTLDWLEERLSGRRWLVGGRLTEADVRLWTTLIRFDTVYHGHFKCNRRKLVEHPALWGFTRDLYQVPGVAGTVDLAQIARHYHWSHPGVNPHRIVPIGPALDLDAPHGRDALP
jgi:putative glutathione S-transferase